MRRLDPSLEPQGRKAGENGRGPGVVVVGVDDTLTASRAVCYAAGVAARNDALLVVVHAERPVPLPAWGGFGLWCAPSVETKEQCQVLREAEHAVERAWDRVEVELRVGEPARQLCQVARDREADVIVVGSSRSWCHRLGGSVAARLAKRGHWPVVVVP